MKPSIKRILVPLDPSNYAQAATISACALAREHRALLAGVAVLDSDGIRSDLVPGIGPYYPMMADQIRERIQHADQVVKDCMERFANTCEKERVAHIQTEYDGVPAEKLLESSIFYDLVVCGLRTFFHFETLEEGDEGRTIDQLLDRTITPVLAVPEKGLEKIDRALVAFDGSFGAARALHDFVQLTTTDAPEVTIVVAEMSAGKSTFLLDQASAFLRTHGIEKIDTVASDASIEETIDSRLHDTDLVVAGIHSKKLIKDLFVGSLVKHLIKRGDTALFLSH